MCLVAIPPLIGHKVKGDVVSGRVVETVFVPTIAGLPLRNAEMLLRQRNLGLGEVSESYSVRMEKGRVLNQDPPAELRMIVRLPRLALEQLRIVEQVANRVHDRGVDPRPLQPRGQVGGIMCARPSRQRRVDIRLSRTASRN